MGVGLGFSQVGLSTVISKGCLLVDTWRSELAGSVLVFPDGPDVPRWPSGEESTCRCGRCQRHRLSPCVGKIPWSRKWQPTPVFLLEKFHEQRSFGSKNSPQGLKESGATDRLSTHAYPHLILHDIVINFLVEDIGSRLRQLQMACHPKK